MKILIADNDISEQKKIADIFSELVHDCSVSLLRDADSALKNPDSVPDIIIIDPYSVSLWQEFLVSLKKRNRRVNIIFCTESSEYMHDAIKLHVSGYILKPADSEKIRNELNNLLYPHEIKIKTFGNFSVFVNEKAVSFRRSKSLEALAFMVDKRTSCTRKQIAACIFEDKVYDRKCQKYLDNILRDLKDDLAEAGISQLILHSNNQYSVNQEICQCDYFDMINGKSKKEFYGEYMSQYSWAEVTLAFLNNM